MKTERQVTPLLFYTRSLAGSSFSGLPKLYIYLWACNAPSNRFLYILFIGKTQTSTHGARRCISFFFVYGNHIVTAILVFYTSFITHESNRNPSTDAIHHL